MTDLAYIVRDIKKGYVHKETLSLTETDAKLKFLRHRFAMSQVMKDGLDAAFDFYGVEVTHVSLPGSHQKTEMRRQFEAWCLSKDMTVVLPAPKDGQYATPEMQLLWEAWQASKASY